MWRDLAGYAVVITGNVKSACAVILTEQDPYSAGTTGTEVMRSCGRIGIIHECDWAVLTFAFGLNSSGDRIPLTLPMCDVYDTIRRDRNSPLPNRLRR